MLLEGLRHHPALPIGVYAPESNRGRDPRALAVVGADPASSSIRSGSPSVAVRFRAGRLCCFAARRGSCVDRGRQ
eukprot:9211542-Heterocapsa_arctica.AAC.1